MRRDTFDYAAPSTPPPPSIPKRTRHSTPIVPIAIMGLTLFILAILWRWIATALGF